MKRLMKIAKEQFTFDYIESLNKEYDYSYFDRDLNFKDSLFELTKIKTPETLNEYMKNDIEIYLDTGYCENDDTEVICYLINLINDNITLVPIVVDKNNNIIDGYHRCSAYNFLNINNINAFKEV